MFLNQSNTSSIERICCVAFDNFCNRRSSNSTTLSVISWASICQFHCSTVGHQRSTDFRHPATSKNSPTKKGLPSVLQDTVLAREWTFRVWWNVSANSCSTIPMLGVRMIFWRIAPWFRRLSSVKINGCVESLVISISSDQKQRLGLLVKCYDRLTSASQHRSTGDRLKKITRGCSCTKNIRYKPFETSDWSDLRFCGSNFGTGDCLPMINFTSGTTSMMTVRCCRAGAPTLPSVRLVPPS